MTVVRPTPPLCICDDATFLPWLSWADIAALPEREKVVVLVPIAGMTEWSEHLPFDAEEQVLMRVVREASRQRAKNVRLLVVPPLRFVAGLIVEGSVFSVEVPVAHAFIDEVCVSLAASGFTKIVLCNASPWNEELCDAAARDIRIARGLQMFCVNLSAFGLDFNARRRAEDRARIEALLQNAAGPVQTETGARLAALLAAIAGRPPLKNAGKILTVGTILEPDGGAGRATSLSSVSKAVPKEVTPPRERTVARLDGHRFRYLPAMTAAQIGALTDKTWAPVIVTTGAIEQHGHHLPVAVDALMGQVWLERVLELLPDGTSCYVAPPITIGKSNEHAGFPGTLMISKETLRLQLFAIARQLSAWGFRQLVILNTHGGNSSVLLYTLREIEERWGLHTHWLKAGVTLDPPLSPPEATYGFHAGEEETSWLLAVAPQYVNMGKAVCEYPTRLDDPGELRLECAPATFAWASQDVSVSGVMGDATAATAEKGERWIATLAAGYAARLKEIAKGRDGPPGLSVQYGNVDEISGRSGGPALPV